MAEDQEGIRRLLIEKLTGTISPEDEQIIDQLIASDNDVLRQWLQMKEKLTHATAHGLFHTPDAASAWQQLKPVIHRKSPVRRIAIAASAAAACLAMVVGARYLLGNPTPAADTPFFAAAGHPFPSDSILLQADNGSAFNLSNEQGRAAARAAHLTITDSTLVVGNSANNTGQWQTLLVPASFMYKVNLSDGSQVWLNAGTRLRFPLGFSGNTREIYVDGEAFFQVAKNEEQPFIVHTAKTNITVTGTAFNVNTYDTALIRTSLTEGSISTTSALGDLQLQPGQEAVYTPASFTRASFDATTTLSWKEGVYYFQDAPLESLAGILHRWFKTEIRFDQPATAKKVFSGVLFKNQPLSAFLENLQLSDNIQTEMMQHTVHFR